MASDTFAKRNEVYWTQAAESTFDAEWVKQLHAQIQTFLTKNNDWLALQRSIKEEQGNKSGPRLLDYACGNGIISRILHPHFSQCIGVDLAESMLAKYRKTAAELGLSEQQMKAVRGNLLNPVPDPTEPPTTREELSDFDLVVICMALHHVDDLELAIKCLAEKLRPGGVILVIDWAKMNAAPASVAGEFTNSSSRGNQQDQNPHPGAHTMSHESFTKDQIVGLFQQAGCNQSRFLLADKLTDVPPAPSGKMQMFFAHAKEIQTVSDVATISV